MTDESRDPTRILITSRDAWLTALRDAFMQVAKSGCRSVALADETFADWPLSEPAVLDQLTRWALPHRRFSMVARQYNDMARRHPRFVDWRRAYSHIVDCRSPDEGAASNVPTLLVAEGLVVVRLVEPGEYRGIVSSDRADLVQCRESIDAVLQRSASAFPATTLGL